MSAPTVHTSTHPIPGGIDLPGVATLLDANAVRGFVNAQLPQNRPPFSDCRIANLRVKNPTSCIVSYDLTRRDPDTGATEVTQVYARAFAPGDYLPARTKALAGRWVDSAEGPAVSPWDECQGLFYWYPNDERLHGLRRIIMPKKLQRLFYVHLADYPESDWRVSNRSIRLRVVRYKPERRAVIHCRFRAHHHTEPIKHERFVYLGLYEDGRDAAIWKTLCDLHGHVSPEATWTVPRPLAFVREHAMIVAEAMPGDSLRTLLGSAGRDGIEPGEALKRAAGAVAGLHGCAARSVPYAGIDTLTGQIAGTTGMLARALPDEQALFTETGRLLDAGLSAVHTGRDDFVHGDLHPGQLLISDTPTGVLDLDRSHRGDSLLDIGNFRAQLWLNAETGTLPEAQTRAECFVTEYERATGRSIDRQALDYWTALALYRSATNPIGRFTPEWPVRVRHIVEWVRTCLP